MKAYRIFLVGAIALMLGETAGSGALAVDSTSVVKHSGAGGRQSDASARTDADGRQIAAILPVPAVPAVLPRKMVAKSANDTERMNNAASGRWKKVTIEVPASLPDAAEFCTITANRFGKVATDKVLQASSWLTAFATRMNSVPTITPAVPLYGNSPNKLQPVSFSENKRWVMPDGRVKTLIKN